MFKRLHNRKGYLLGGFEYVMISVALALITGGAVSGGGDKDGSLRNNPDWHKVATKQAIHGLVRR